MKKSLHYLLTALFLLSACSPTQSVSRQDTGNLKILAGESFLADIVENVAGTRGQVETIIPEGMDPHAFELTPQDMVRVSKCDVLVLNGGDLEHWSQSVMKNVRVDQVVIEASQGLESRKPDAVVEAEHDSEIDPHFWLNPLMVVQYVNNIRDGLIRIDPSGEKEYAANAEVYNQKLNKLDSWIVSQVEQIPMENRLLVTNHESFGYFADRYGFRIVGTIIPSVSTGASPSALQLANLVDEIKSTGAPAIFIEAGSNLQLADQIGTETGVRIVTGLNTHSVPSVGNKKSGYIEMMEQNVTQIVNALK